MQPNIFTVIVLVLIGIILAMRNRLKWAWRFFVVSQVFAATSIASLSGLGGASFAVSQVGVVVLVVAAFFVIAPRDNEAMRRSLQINAVALGVIIYTLLISYWGPRLFAGQMQLIGMRPTLINGIAVPVPLGPSSTNITHAAYLTGSLLTAVATAVVFGRALPAREFRGAVLALGLCHVGFGLIDAAGGVIGLSGILNFLRNANFTMVEQSIGNVRRLSGSLPEPSSYASLAIPLAVFATEDWLRTRARLSGVTGALLWTMTLASTSTTGIVSAAIYLAVAVPRILFLRGRFGMKVAFIGVVAGAALAFAAISLASPDVFAAIRDFVFGLTIDKGDSDSAIERASWTAQGLQGFLVSHGLGIGAGSFRCSNYLFAVLGSLGFIGSVLLATYLAQVARVVAIKTSDATQRSAAWAAFFVLVPALFSGTTPDPGFLFGMFAGFALHPHLAAIRRPAVPATAHVMDAHRVGLP